MHNALQNAKIIYMQIAKKSNKKKYFLIFIFIFGVTCAVGSILLITFFYKPVHSPNKKVTPSQQSTNNNRSNTAQKTEKPVIPTFNKSLYSTTDPASIWLVVNKQHPLSTIDYIPTDLINTNGATISAKAQADFEAMMTTASVQGINLVVGSSYRSYANQTSLYNSYVASNGQAVADTFSAKPGYSEHQTGLAIDFTGNSNPNCNYDDCYATTAEGGWLNAHAYEYGFLLRYTAEKQSITGYKNEPWHYRYIGKELAKEMKSKNITTLEEFFNITGGISY